MYGSRPLTTDKRDKTFSHARYFGVAPLSSLPPTLVHTPLAIKDQRNTNFCTAFATSTASEYQEGVLLSPEYQTAKISQRSRHPILDGADPRIALDAATIFGSLPAELSPFSLDTEDPDFIANWNNWPSPLDLKAAPYEKQSYFWIHDGSYLPFDNIRMALFQHEDKNAVGMAFTPWYREWEQFGVKTLPTGTEIVGWHAWVIRGYDGDYLVCQNSWGTSFGENGSFYLHKDIVNQLFAISGTGAAMFVDLDPNVVTRFKLHHHFLSFVYWLESFIV